MVPVPTHNLSDDILREIFLQCLEKDHWGVSLSPDEAPMLLLRICVRWRMVALEYGPLWSRLNLPLRRETLDKTKCRFLV
ncbi:hypothetical protein FA13DRAFT_113209 [Coprinellus micaceus]|uniref:F-box domain-containing protein n=1 Tax=Coprinellus micaceus TaxID=71717 RepID=A0A4Y7TIL3_COPMI|nr:hypothetical protein FA13DRAFT_113209 [Coprinellus micaceus]